MKSFKKGTGLIFLASVTALTITLALFMNQFINLKYFVKYALSYPTNVKVLDLTDKEVFKDTKNWELFTGDRLGFSIWYPSETMEYYQSEDGSTSFWFKDSIYKIPYAPLQILWRSENGGIPKNSALDEMTKWLSTGDTIPPDYVEIRLNNSKGVMITNQYYRLPRIKDDASNETGYNLYITDLKNKGQVVRIIAEKNGIDDFDILEKIVKTFQFKR